MRVGLLPLDERPANTRDPRMVAAIAGVDLVLPPADLLSAFRTPAPCDRLGAWLRQTAPQLDALIVSIEMLGYGGLIASRITHDPASAILQRLDVLRDIKRDLPSLPIYGFNVITRVSDADNAIEEPDYWAQHGSRLYRYSQLLDRQAQGEAVDDELAALEDQVPAAHRRDFLQRRDRNHQINIAALRLLADRVFDLLVLSSDDTSAYGLPSHEKRALIARAEHSGLLRATTNTHDFQPPVRSPQPPLLMYPGADEVGCVLLARLINQRRGVVPRFRVDYAIPDHAEVTAPYEDGPARVTVERQIAAIGGVLVDGEADLYLAVNPPVPGRREWQPEFAEQDWNSRLSDLHAFVEQLRRREEAGQPVIVADVAYPNGADPLLVDLLRRRVFLLGLSAYGAWNTAGNTIGTALAQGCAVTAAFHDASYPQTEMLLHRLIEDWAYQQVVRQQARAWLRSKTRSDEPTAENVSATVSWIENRLNALLAELPGFDGDWRVANVRLPWGRLFEVDFDLERRVPGANRWYTDHHQCVTPGIMPAEESA